MEGKRELAELLDLLKVSELDLQRFAIRNQKYYREFQEQKKCGGTRCIVAPTEELKRIQRLIARLVLEPIALDDSCTGFRKGKSILSNAMPHVDQEFVLNLDLKDFFPSITFDRVCGLFQNLGWSRPTAVLLTRVTTFKGVLPQGAPSSPLIANLICRNLDKRLKNYCQIRNWQYTRYCDDLSISGPDNPRAAIATIFSIIAAEGFKINDKKTRTRFKHQQQSVTGVVVNETARIPRAQRRRLRAVCHQLRLDPESFRGVSDSILGQLSFANMIEGLLKQDDFGQVHEILLDMRREANLAGAIY